MPRGELLAGTGIAIIVHPLTLTRFGCYSTAEFTECLGRIHENLRTYDPDSWYSSRAFEPAVVDFATLSEAFVERTQLVSEKNALDAETRRAWVALRWCLHEYARRCTGGHEGYDRSARGGKNLTILLGESTSAEAWTDGKSYIACNVKVVRRLRSEPLRTAGYLFSLIEHEAAHEGDSMDCGHDEAFYQRFHDISINLADVRQRYIHVWMMKYTTSMENEGKKAAGKAWQERYLSDRVGNGREKRGLPRLIDEASLAADIHADVPEENPLLITRLNLQLRHGSDPRPEPDWDYVKLNGILTFLRKEEARRQITVTNALRFDYDAADQDDDPEWLPSLQDDEDNQAQYVEQEKDRIAGLLNIHRDLLADNIFFFLWLETDNEDDLLAAWQEKRWEGRESVDDWLCSDDQSWEEAQEAIPEDWKPYLRPGETRWMIERNAAAAGFTFMGHFRAELYYLKWRAAQEEE